MSHLRKFYLDKFLIPTGGIGSPRYNAFHREAAAYRESLGLLITR